MKVAIVHDFLHQYGGGEKVVEALLKHKLVKKTGKKDEKTKSFHVALSQAGEKFLKSSSAPSPKA